MGLYGCRMYALFYNEGEFNDMNKYNKVKHMYIL